MNIYLCGQKYFGYLTLQMMLAEGHNVIGVSAPEPKDGKPDRLWQHADLKHIPLLPAGKLNADTLPPNIDLIVCAHSHDFVGRKTRNRCKLGAIGYHPSLLPLHRGRDAVKWAIKLRERVTGGTVFWLNDTVDGGPIAAQEHCFIKPEWDATELWREALQPLGINLFRRVLSDINRKVITKIPQDTSVATWEPALDPPALYRPDLPQIGATLDGYTVKVYRDEFEGLPVCL
jgi:methionyl-tRNA formyltransferase